MNRMIPYILSALFVFGVCGFAVCLCKAASHEGPITIPPEPKIQVKRMARSLAQTENWNGVSRGKSGERGRLQWKERTWRDFSTKPFFWAEGRTLAAQLEVESAEERYVIWLIHSCSTIGRKATPYTVALIHTAGFGVVETGHPSAAKKDFAQRCQNLYEDDK